MTGRAGVVSCGPGRAGCPRGRLVHVPHPCVPLFPVRMDENYSLLPHGVNFQDAVFPDTQENRRAFSSLFQFSNCSHGQPLAALASDWEVQEDNQVSVRCALGSSRATEWPHLVSHRSPEGSRIPFRQPRRDGPPLVLVNLGFLGRSCLAAGSSHRETVG